MASDENLISVTAEVTSNALPVVSGLVGALAPGGAVTFPAFLDELPDGLRTIIITATDAAGNTSTDQRSYTKDTAPPLLSNLTAADGNPIRHFQLTATTSFAPSAECSTFPFTGCVFNIPASAPTEDVDYKATAESVETYRRWQHLVGALANPASVTAGGATAPAENRAPTLRLKTEAGMAVEARIDQSCPTNEAEFESRTRGQFVASAVGLVDVPIVDAQNLTSGALLRTSKGGDAVPERAPVDRPATKVPS